MNIYKLFKILFLICITFLLSTKNIEAQGNAIKAKITNILEEKEIQIEDKSQLYQKIELKILNGEDKNKIINIENGNLAITNSNVYKKNEILLVIKEVNLEGNEVWQISDYVRSDGLLLLFIIFVFLVLLISKFRGLMSIISMGITFGIVFYFILPQIINGKEPIIVAIIGAMMIIPITFFMSHGFNKKTLIAIVGTVISMIITGVLTIIFMEMGKMTGFSSEDAGMLTYMVKGGINMKGVLLAGIIIGAIGVMDDITVAQASVVKEIREAAVKIKFGELYKRAMKVGQDHISSMINTLILVYAGAAMPLMLIFVNNPHPISEIINYEFIAEEIIRTLTGSIGLILAVPITTLLATYVFINQNNKVK